MLLKNNAGVCATVALECVLQLRIRIWIRDSGATEIEHKNSEMLVPKRSRRFWFAQQKLEMPRVGFLLELLLRKPKSLTTTRAKRR
jgi:hypothetical protein